MKPREYVGLKETGVQDVNDMDNEELLKYAKGDVTAVDDDPWMSLQRIKRIRRRVGEP